MDRRSLTQGLGWQCWRRQPLLFTSVWYNPWRTRIKQANLLFFIRELRALVEFGSWGIFNFVTQMSITGKGCLFPWKSIKIFMIWLIFLMFQTTPPCALYMCFLRHRSSFVCIVEQRCHTSSISLHLIQAELCTTYVLLAWQASHCRWGQGLMIGTWHLKTLSVEKVTKKVVFFPSPNVWHGVKRSHYRQMWEIPPQISCQFPFLFIVMSSSVTTSPLFGPRHKLVFSRFFILLQGN